MKKFIVFSTLFILITAAQALAQGVSHATIYSADNYKFTVFLNGEKKNEKPLANVRMINLPQLYYKLKITFEDTTLAPIEKKIFNIQDANGNHVDATYEIVMKKGEPSIAWRSQTVNPRYIETQPTVVIVNNAPSTTVQQTTTTTTTSTPENDAVKLNTVIGEITINPNGSSGSGQEKTTTTTTVVSGSSGTAATTSGNCTGTMLNEADFNEAVNSIAARSTEDSKLIMAKQIMSGSCMSCAQVKQMIELLSTEAARLDLAKYAYARTIDKGNYFKINSVFKEDKSVDELNQYIVK